ncbi:hypothetical protein GCM10011360_04480 [Primorskyibacter flagellatus]|uniref:Uncharacterized protein n=1 Tax=Primorskyibacter flagellatus TaxID=1387277 RepID=A0A917EBJ4_9RHOB|nr:hypothetical protein GCM10011360_04480 [Primorskyibacter flagellatus]
MNVTRAQKCRGQRPTLGGCEVPSRQTEGLPPAKRGGSGAARCFTPGGTLVAWRTFPDNTGKARLNYPIVST